MPLHRLACATAVVVVLVVAMTGCDDADASFVPPAPGPLRAAAVVRALRLPVGHPTAGYFQGNNLGDDPPPDDPGSPFADTFPSTRGVQSAPSARVIVLDNGHTDLVLVRLDMAYTTEEITATTLRRVDERLGRDLRGRLLINSTHTHSAGQRASANSTRPAALSSYPPEQGHAWAVGGDTFSAESLERIVEPIVDAIEEGYATLRPARFGYGFGENTTAAGDRRCESDWLEGPDQSDKRVTVMRIDDDDTGLPIALVVGYAMHGIIYDRDNRHLSVDAPGHVEYALESLLPTPTVAFYLQGNVGDSSPRGASRGHRASQAMMRAGWDLAQTVLEVSAAIETKRDVELAGIDRVIALGHDRLGYAPDEFSYGGGLLCSTGREGCGVTSPATPAEVFCLGQADASGAKTRTWISALRIGNLHVLGVPGEPVATFGRSVIDEVSAVLPKGADVVIAGLAMDHNGYLLEPDDWLSGGYEPTVSPWGWRMGPYLRGQLVDLARELTTGEARDSQATARVDFHPDAWTPVKATTSAVPPAELEVPRAVVERLESVAWGFEGGDPAVDQPVITVERQADDGAWVPVLDGAWKPVSSATGPRLPLFYTATPTFRDAPDAQVRDHRWRVQWEPPRDAVLGSHRFSVRGHHFVDGAAAEYQLTSTPFEVVANDGLIVDASLGTTPKRSARLTLRYPALPAAFSPLVGSEDWQIDGFTLVDPWFSPPFVPVLAGSPGAGNAAVAVDGLVVDEPLSFAGVDDVDVAALPISYAPGEGPGFSVALPAGATMSTWELHLDAGALQDAWGNGNAATTLVLGGRG